MFSSWSPSVQPQRRTAPRFDLIVGEKSRARLVDWLVAHKTGGERIRAGLPRGWKCGDKTGPASAAVPMSRSGSCINVFRPKQSLREHLNTLDHLDNRRYEMGADLFRIHLRLSRSRRPQAARHGAALFGVISRPD
ncbi:hypothetical protein LB524_20105 [Mesorhizobium sp. ESP6-5]|uniref:hypothetical protein n=1 Tax=unclassified Mesorhizobium TaxID=325217 RepID=UPI001CCFBC27|nr:MULTISPECIES: hypothetical protein [unclassified Mesorhizobium]MBZ9695919.1 hypothetical protein [Mesorhizobium sp. CO1-1-9]MBZ9757594.1 hypothetical protein [Mesorhizobium sp. ESP6-5]